MTAEQTENPATIQQEVERTQDAIGETVQKIEDQLSPRKMAQSLFSDQNADAAQDAWEIVRSSPLPVAMILGGTAWLLATSNARMISRLREELKARFRSAVGDQSRSNGTSSVGPPPAAGEAYDRRSATAGV